MGMLYRRKYKRKDGTVATCATWWCKIYVNGQPIRLNTKTTRQRAARDFMRAKETDGKRGLPVLAKVNRKTVGDLLEDVVNDYRANGQRSLDGVICRVEKYLRPYFGTLNAACVTDDQVRQYITQRRDAGAAPATVNRELAVLGRGYRLNKRTVTVAPEIPTLREQNARKGFFERAAFEAVRDALPVPFRPLLAVAYITGWRVKSELLPMEWRQVDFKARVLRLEPNTTKNGLGREFPFTEALEAALLAQRAYTDTVQKQRGAIIPHVFHRATGARVRTWRRPWLKALLRVGLAHRETNEDGTLKPGGRIIPHVIPHDFRRTAIRNLARAGVSEAIAMKMCGHETRAVFDRYNITTGDDLRAAAAKLDAVSAAERGTVSGTVAPVEALSATAGAAKSSTS
jgi:integrase